MWFSCVLALVIDMTRSDRTLGHPLSKNLTLMIPVEESDVDPRHFSRRFPGMNLSFFDSCGR